jgi:hypothetical protein
MISGTAAQALALTRNVVYAAPFVDADALGEAAEAEPYFESLRRLFCVFVDEKVAELQEIQKCKIKFGDLLEDFTNTVPFTEFEVVSFTRMMDVKKAQGTASTASTASTADTADTKDTTKILTACVPNTAVQKIGIFGYKNLTPNMAAVLHILRFIQRISPVADRGKADEGMEWDYRHIFTVENLIGNLRASLEEPTKDNFLSKIRNFFLDPLGDLILRTQELLMLFRPGPEQREKEKPKEQGTFFSGLASMVSFNYGTAAAQIFQKIELFFLMLEALAKFVLVLVASSYLSTTFMFAFILAPFLNFFWSFTKAAFDTYNIFNHLKASFNAAISKFRGWFQQTFPNFASLTAGVLTGIGKKVTDTFTWLRLQTTSGSSTAADPTAASDRACSKTYSDCLRLCAGYLWFLEQGTQSICKDEADEPVSAPKGGRRGAATSVQVYGRARRSAKRQFKRDLHGLIRGVVMDPRTSEHVRLLDNHFSRLSGPAAAATHVSWGRPTEKAVRMQSRSKGSANVVQTRLFM